MARQKSKRDFNADVDRAQVIAATLLPGDGLVPKLKDGEGQTLLLELLGILAGCDDRDEREAVVRHVGETLFTTTFEGHGVIEAYVERARGGQGKGGIKK